MENIPKTLLSEEPFGIRSMERLDVGDLVKWTELNSKGTHKIPKIGIISDIFLEKRGNREVALANVHEITDPKQNLPALGRKVEVLVVCLELISKVTAKK